ncbi:MAG: hypothetical protein GVY28_05415 [Alphaproteobacteria bacterium]|jgi:hypothetical protein|nr:hypothetical protein [Alphaproteobacteria bacterium]
MSKSKDRRDRHDPPSRERSKPDRRPSKPDRDKPRSDKPRSEKPRRDPSRPDRSKPGRDGDRPGWRDENRSWPGADGPGRGDPDKPRGGKPGRDKPGHNEPGHDKPGAAKPRPSKPGPGRPERGEGPTAGPGLLAPRPPARRRPGRDEVARWIEKRRGPGFHRWIDPARGPIDDPWEDSRIDRSDQVGALDRPTGPAEGDPAFREGRPRGSLPLDGDRKPDPSEAAGPDGKIHRRADTRARLARLRAGKAKPGEGTPGVGKPAAGDLRLGDRVGDGRPNRPDDVRAVKQALAAAGRFPNDPKRLAEPMIDRDLVDGLIGLQKDRGLKVDGWLVPGGETERALAEAAREKRGKQSGRQRPVQQPGGPLEFFYNVATELGSWVFDSELAGEFYDHFQDGTGELFEIDADRIKDAPAIVNAVEWNLERFETLVMNPNVTMKTDPRTGRELTDEEALVGLRSQIAELEDGATMAVEATWDTPVEAQDHESLDMELAIGNAHVRSRANLTAEREGETIRFTGEITHRLNDRHDFSNSNMVSRHQNDLVDYERAAEFDIISEWTVPVDVRLHWSGDEPGSAPSWDWREGR